MIITLIFKHKNDAGTRTDRAIEFEGTPEECAKAQEWPSFTLTDFGQNLIRRMVTDPAIESWEIFCCGG
jgi:hypothetical protein